MWSTLMSLLPQCTQAPTERHCSPVWAPADDMQPKPRVKAHLGCDPSHQVWIVRTSGKGNTLMHQRVFPLDPYVHMWAGVVHATIQLGGKDGLG